jgi:hypothetical protein
MLYCAELLIAVAVAVQVVAVFVITIEHPHLRMQNIKEKIPGVFL